MYHGNKSQYSEQGYYFGEEQMYGSDRGIEIVEYDCATEHSH
jgi:hypothetical protein|tara:strand:+ start:177 stop:302 length:126 start_codon:yes stop_codon:yes gene_type:complete